MASHLSRFLDVCGSTLTRAWLPSGAPPSGPLRVTVQRSHRDVAAGVSRRTLQSYLLVNDEWHAGGPPLSLPPSAVHVSPSPSGARFAVLKNDEGGAGAPPPPPAAPGAKARVCVELWDVPTGALLRAVTSPEGLHSVPLADGGFFSEGLSWSSCERFVAFVAEGVAPHVGVLSACAALPPTAPPEGAAGGGGGGAAVGGAERAPRGRAAEWGAGGREDWGEKYVGIRAPRPFVVDFERGMMSAVEGIDGDVAVGQPVFAPRAVAGGGGAPPLTLAFAGWRADGPQRLGLIHCYNRPVALYLANISHLLTAAPPAPAGEPPPAPPPVLCLTPGLRSARSPRFSPNGAHLAFLSAAGASTYAHGGASELRALDWHACAGWAAAAWAAGAAAARPPPPPPPSTLLLPIVANPWAAMGAPSGGAASEAALRNNAFWPGLFAGALPLSPWSPDDPNRLFFNTQAGFRLRVGSVDVGEGALSLRWEDGAGAGGSSGARCNPPSAVFWGAAAGGRVLLSTSTLTAPEALFLFSPQQEAAAPAILSPLSAAPPPDAWAHEAALPLGGHGNGHKCLWGGRAAAATDAGALCAHVFPVHPAPAHTGAPGDAYPFEAALLWSEDAAASAPAGGLPLVLVPHGGPHAAFSTAFGAHHAFLAASGVAVLLVNYRGSTGYGDEALASLPGRVGSADVGDCVAALGAALSLGGGSGGGGALPRVDPARVAVSGGSHGGFLAAHLVSQEGTRERFRAAILRNPVTDVSAMQGATDIPDWCWVEAFGAAGGAMPPALSAAHRAAMFASSPMAHVGRVRVAPVGGGHATPVLLMLGLKDRRVPPSQGLAWWHALRAVGWEHGGAGAVPDTHARLLLYPEDTHALDAPATEADAWVQIAQWLAVHLAPQE